MEGQGCCSFVCIQFNSTNQSFKNKECVTILFDALLPIFPLLKTRTLLARLPLKVATDDANQLAFPFILILLLYFVPMTRVRHSATIIADNVLNSFTLLILFMYLHTQSKRCRSCGPHIPSFLHCLLPTYLEIYDDGRKLSKNAAWHFQQPVARRNPTSICPCRDSA